MRSLFAALALIALPMLLPGAAIGAAGAGLPALCERAAREAGARHGLPAGLLEAISLVETGRRHGGSLRPWPWALNDGAAGHWFASRAELLAGARRLLAQGRRSFDVGCFQLNYRWHGARFASLDAMLDPQRGADYAARFLRGLYAESGNWLTAAGWYHSRTPDLTARYRGRVETVLAALGPDLREAPVPEPRAVRNEFRLALAGGASARAAAPARAAAGSLFAGAGAMAGPKGGTAVPLLRRPSGSLIGRRARPLVTGG